MQFKSRLDSDGGLRLSSGAADGLLSISNSSGDLVWGNTVRPSSSSAIGLIVKGVASQSGDLQEWQASDAAVKAKITSGGSIATVADMVANLGGASTQINLGGDGKIYWGTGFAVNVYASSGTRLQTDNTFATSQRLSVGAQSTPTAIQAQVVVNTASDIGVIVKGAASQSGSLQEWRNTSDAVLASIDSAGNFIAANQYYVNHAKWMTD